MSDADIAFFETLAAHVEERIPGFAVRFKDESRSQRALALLLKPIVPGYLTRYTTTLYPVVWYTSRDELARYPRSSWQTLAHEYVHLHDQRRARVRFPLGYVFPQILALGALGTVAALWSPWAWLCLLSLGALAPWPAPFRARAELRGYAMDLAVRYWREGEAWGTDSLAETFTGWAYYRMWPDERAVKEALAQVVNQLTATSLPFAAEDVEGEAGLTPYIEVRRLMRRAGIAGPGASSATTAVVET